MTLLNLLTATLDDIVFERRNKAYGAYLLRRLYNRHLATAVTIASAICFLLVAIPMLVQQLWPTVQTTKKLPFKQVIEFTDIILPPKPITPAAQPKAIHPPVVKIVPQTIPTKVVADDKAKPEVKDITIEPPVVPLGAIAGSENLPGEIGAAGRELTSSGTDSGSAKGAAAPAAPFAFAEVMPEFTGGQEALRRYMQRNLHYPSAALANSIAGKVFVSFVVSADGTISNVEVLKGLGYGTDEEAIRVVKNMPTWKPGRQNNHTVSVRYTLPITFRYE